MKYIIFFLIFNINYFAAAATVDIRWQKHNFNLDVQTYEAAENRKYRISETEIYSSKDKLPVSGRAKTKFDLQPDAGKPLIIVIENNTKVDQYFQVAPHQIEPADGSTGFYFECLCTDRIYKIGPGQLWTRVLRMNLKKEAASAKEFKVSHMFIGVTPELAQTKYKARVFEAGESK